MVDVVPSDRVTTWQLTRVLLAARLRAQLSYRGSFVGDVASQALLALTELAARFNLDFDWDVEDPTDDAFLAGASTAALLEAAHEQLRLDGYTLWTRETGDDTVAGWMTLSSDDEAMRVIAPALGIEVRPAGI